MDETLCVSHGKTRESVLDLGFSRFYYKHSTIIIYHLKVALNNKMKNCLYLFLFVIAVSISSCDQEDVPSIDISVCPCIESIHISKEKNPGLESDIDITSINDTLINIYAHHLKADSICFSINGTFSGLMVNDEVISEPYMFVSDISHSIRCTLLNDMGMTYNYIINVVGYNGLPVIEINTENNKGIDSKTDYTKADICFKNSPEFGPIKAAGKIRGRGNWTWNLPKKPYKIKFSEKQSPCGFSENKDFVLLADFIDRSLIRSAFMCEVSQAIDMPYAIHYHLVELYINDEYHGVYVLTDQVEKAKNRISIEKDGFIIEEDSYYENEALWFSTDTYGYNYTFKYPDADDGDIVKDDANYLFISNYLKNFEASLTLLDTDPDDLTYLNFLEPHSFAKWYIVMQLLAIEDPNRFYVLASQHDKLIMSPMWDAEFSLGLWATSWRVPRPDNIAESTTTYALQMKRLLYTEQLLKSSYFHKLLHEEWIFLKGNLSVVLSNIKNLETRLEYAQKDNFEKWPNQSDKIDTCFSAWEEEVEFVYVFLNNRILLMDSLFQ